MTLDDRKYMMMALQEAQKAYELEEVPIGAVASCQISRIL